MDTLSYGVKKPSSGDKGSLFFPALESNAQIQNDHDHDGVDSALIVAKNVTKGSVTVTALSWIASGDYFRKLVSLPSGYVWGSHDVIVMLFDGVSVIGERLFPKLEQASISTMYVYMPTSNQALKILFV